MWHSQTYDIFLSLRVVLIFANSVDPDEMPLGGTSMQIIKVYRTCKGCLTQVDLFIKHIH